MIIYEPHIKICLILSSLFNKLQEVKPMHTTRKFTMLGVNLFLGGEKTFGILLKEIVTNI